MHHLTPDCRSSNSAAGQSDIGSLLPDNPAQLCVDCCAGGWQRRHCPESRVPGVSDGRRAFVLVLVQRAAHATAAGEPTVSPVAVATSGQLAAARCGFGLTCTGSLRSGEPLHGPERWEIPMMPALRRKLLGTASRVRTCALRPSCLKTWCSLAAPLARHRSEVPPAVPPSLAARMPATVVVKLLHHHVTNCLCAP